MKHNLDERIKNCICITIIIKGLYASGERERVGEKKRGREKWMKHNLNERMGNDISILKERKRERELNDT